MILMCWLLSTNTYDRKNLTKVRAKWNSFTCDSFFSSFSWLQSSLSCPFPICLCWIFTMSVCWATLLVCGWQRRVCWTNRTSLSVGTERWEGSSEWQVRLWLDWMPGAAKQRGQRSKWSWEVDFNSGGAHPVRKISRGRSHWGTLVGGNRL